MHNTGAFTTCSIKFAKTPTMAPCCRSRCAAKSMASHSPKTSSCTGIPHTTCSAGWRIAVRHGLRLRAGPILADRVECDAMYVDIRTRLGLQPGERVDLSHLQD